MSPWNHLKVTVEIRSYIDVFLVSVSGYAPPARKSKLLHDSRHPTFREACEHVGGVLQHIMLTAAKEEVKPYVD